MEFEEPITLVRIPKALQDNTPPKFGHVFGLSAGQKRKRHEICAAVDGDSINIYEASKTNVLSSYPIPPAACFSCPPCSIRVKSTGGALIRHTYCSTKKVAQQVESFTERFDGDRSLGVVHTISKIEDTESPVVHLDTIPSTDIGHNILVVHQNGLIRLFSEGLQKEMRTMQLVDMETTSIFLVAAHWNSFEQAQSSILKHRPDLISTISSESAVLVGLYRDSFSVEAKLNVGLWAISSEQIPAMNASKTPLKPIVSYALLDSKVWSTGSEIRCNFSAKASILSISSTRGIVNYDLCAYLPRVSWDLLLDQHDLFAATRLNNFLMVGATPTSLVIYDSKFSSIRASLDLTKVKRRKRAPDTANRGPVQLVTYFPQLKRLLGTRGNFLVAFDLRGVESKARSKEALLIDSIGRGLPGKTKSKSSTTNMKLNFGVVDDLVDIANKDWASIKQRLNVSAASGDVIEFERIISQELGGSNGEPVSAHSIGDDKLKFLLSSVFRYVPELAGRDTVDFHGKARLEVAVAAQGLLSWFIRSGLLVRHTLEKALKTLPLSPKELHVKGGMIAAALMQSDSTLTLMTTYIGNAESLDALELAASVKLLLIVAVAEAGDFNTVKPLLLENADRMDEDQKQTDTVKLEDDRHVNNVLGGHHSSVTSFLISVLEILAGYGSYTISSNLQSTLNQADLLALIQFLRRQLFQGGHTMSLSQQSYRSTSSGKSTLDRDASEAVLSLEAISKLLLGSIDAMGSLGFLVNAADSEFLQTLVPELKSEIALAMEGIEEVSYLRGVFRETMRYAESTDKKTLDKATASLDGASAQNQQPGTIVTLFSEPSAEQGDVEVMNGMLPLSLRAENVVNKSRMRKGGGQIKLRSQRETREIEHRNRGKYSFERLVL